VASKLRRAIACSISLSLSARSSRKLLQHHFSFATRWRQKDASVWILFFIVPLVFSSKDLVLYCQSFRAFFIPLIADQSPTGRKKLYEGGVWRLGLASTCSGVMRSDAEDYGDCSLFLLLTRSASFLIKSLYFLWSLLGKQRVPKLRGCMVGICEFACRWCLGHGTIFSCHKSAMD
jgi:hypothetical protein